MKTPSNIDKFRAVLDLLVEETSRPPAKAWIRTVAEFRAWALEHGIPVTNAQICQALRERGWTVRRGVVALHLRQVHPRAA